MKKILLKLDNPSDVFGKYASDVNYAMVADNIADFEEEGKLILCYSTKEAFEQGNGTLTYIDDFDRECIYEWTASFI